MLRRLRERIERVRWEDAAELSWWVKFARGQAGLYIYILRELVRNRCLQQAAALTYTTLLSLVPLFAVAFSLYRSFAGIETMADRAQGAIFEFLLARPLLERVSPSELTALVTDEVSDEPGGDLLLEAGQAAERGEAAEALRLCLLALGGHEPGRVRDDLSALRLPGAAVVAGYVSRLSEGDLRSYLEAAGLRWPGAPGRGGATASAREHFRSAVRSYGRGRLVEALDELRAAETGGYSPAETRELACSVQRGLGQQSASQGDLSDAIDWYRKALTSCTDAVVLLGREGDVAAVEDLLRQHRQTRQQIGEALLSRGGQQAELYVAVLEGSGVGSAETLGAAAADLGEAARLLDDPARAHVSLAELLWHEPDRREEARRHYQAAIQMTGGVAAKGISSAVADYIQGFISKVGRARIGILATVFLIVTATSLFSTIEKTLNSIWQVAERRPFWVKFTSFWTLICLGPVLVGTTIWFRESMGRYLALAFGEAPVIGALVRIAMAGGRQVLPFVTTWLLLVAVYMFLPHTKVRFRSAAWGACVGALLLQLARPLFTLYVLSAVKYERIYGSLGAIPIFLLWVWLLWVIVLFGAEVSFTIQNLGLLRYRDRMRTLSDSFIDRYLAARMMMYVGREFWRGEPPVSAVRLAEIMRITPEEASDAAGRLVRLGLLTPVGDEMDLYHPARDLSQLRLSEVLSITDRFRGESRSARSENRAYEDRLEQVFRSAIQAQDSALAGLTFRDLLLQCEGEDRPGEQSPA
jgi:membrane protein